MFDLDNKYAREQAIAIASDRISFLPDDAQKAGLLHIELALEKWKLTQADPDGTVEVTLPVIGGLLDSPPGVPLSHIAAFGQKRRFPVSKVRPEQCGGEGISSAADLFRKLDESDHPLMKDLPKVLRGDAGVALLIQRDGLSMPLTSLTFHIRLIWILVWETTKAYREELIKLNSKRAGQNADARAQAKAAIARNAADRADTIHRMGVEISCGSRTGETATRLL
jgi:hypothetical protein